jgi:hypothetical protein
MSERIIDVRLNHQASNGETNIRDEIVKGLSRPVGQKILPQLVLYDEEGLRIFDDITTQVDDYYIFPAEESLLKRYANDIVQAMQGRHGHEDKDYHGPVPIGGVVLELGAGYVHQFQALYWSTPLFTQVLPLPCSFEHSLGEDGYASTVWSASISGCALNVPLAFIARNLMSEAVYVSHFLPMEK